MADAYIEVPITTDEETLADGAVDRLQTEWDGWTPNEGDLEVVVIEIGANMIGDAASTAAQVPSAVFRTILQELHGVDYIDGTPANTTVTFQLNDPAPNLIGAGTELDIDGFAFTVDENTATDGATVPNVPVTAGDVGTEFNGLSGETTSMLTSVSFIDTFTVDAPTANGTDAESDEDFQDRGSRELELQAKTLVTVRDYELMALSRAYVGRVVVTSNPATRQVTVIASQIDGTALTPAEKTDLDELLQAYRLSTWQVLYNDATVTVINVTYDVHAYPSTMLAPMVSRINDALTAYLDPRLWGTPLGGDPSSRKWYVEPRVRKNELIARIDQVAGVDYVIDVTITGSAGTLQSNGDWLMPGTVPLADAGAFVSKVDGAVYP